MRNEIIPRWSLEVVRMFFYMMFPVGCFHYFNNPQIYEESVTKIRQETQLPIPLDKQEEFNKVLKEVKTKMNLKRIQELEESDKKSLHNFRM